MSAPTFDGEAFLATLEPPRYRIGRRVYEGRILSAQDWFRFEARLQTIGEASADVQAAILRDVTDAMFPSPRWWQFWRPCVSAHLLGLPQGAQIAAFASFVVAQAAMQQMTMPGRPSENTTPTRPSS
jgi:hypothetical protein